VKGGHVRGRDAGQIQCTGGELVYVLSLYKR